MKLDPKRIKTIVSSYIGQTFFYNTIIDVTDDYCVTFADSERIVERTLSEFVDVAKSLTHPLFKSKLESDFSKENLERAFEDRRTIRVEALIKDYSDKGEYHWYRLRLVPIYDDSHNIIFFFNMLRGDDDIKKTENNRSEIFNKAVIEQLIYNYILVYVIDLSNGMSRLVYSNEGDDYDTYARQFESHLDMMRDACDKFISEDFKTSFTRFMDYEYIKEQLKEKDRLVLIFRDKNGTAFEMTFSKYPEYADDYPIVVFALKELD